MEFNCISSSVKNGSTAVKSNNVLRLIKLFAEEKSESEETTELVLCQC